jgi:hypothetical protein
VLHTRQGCSSALVTETTPVARISPVAGRKRVSSLAVPARSYACGCHAGWPSACELRPRLWDGLIRPGFVLRSRGRMPAASACSEACSIRLFFPASGRHTWSPCRSCAPAMRSRCWPRRRAPRCACADRYRPPACQHLADRFARHVRQRLLAQRCPQHQQRPGRGLILFSIGLALHARPGCAPAARSCTSAGGLVLRRSTGPLSRGH